MTVMFARPTWRLGKIAGIPIALHPTWLALYAMVAWFGVVAANAMAEGNHWPQLGRASSVALGLVFSLLLFASVLAHEMAHILVARRQGTPVGGITLFLFGGVANIKREPATAEHEALMAVAGPAMSLLLGAVFAGIALPLPITLPWGNDLFWLLSFSNVVLAVFNLLPAFPNDGGRLVRALVWQLTRSQARATVVAGSVGIAIAAGLVAAGLYFAFYARVPGPHAIVDVKGSWWVLIGLFLGYNAYASVRGARIGLILESMPVEECMATTLIPVPAGTTIAGFVAEMAVNGRAAAYPVVLDGTLIGLVTLQDVAAVPHTVWQQTPVTAVMTSVGRTPGIPPSTRACEALASLDAHHVGELPVFEDGSLTGVVSKETIYAAVRSKERAARA